MQCVNHPGIEAQSYCQNCGKALCANCIRTTASGQILCEPCVALTGGDPSQAYWQAAAQSFAVPPPGSPNPSVAAVLGLIPGVGAMYNGQFFKGLIHVVVFAVLVSITDHYMIFLIFVFAWCLYQSFEAFHTAKARRDGLPLPDPFGLNELGNWLNIGGGRGMGIHHSPQVGVPPVSGAPAAGQTAPPGVATEPPPFNASSAGTQGYGYTPPYAPPAPPPPAGYQAAYQPSSPAGSQAGYQAGYPGGYPAGYQAGYQADYQSGNPSQQPFTEPYSGTNPDPYSGGYPPGAYPPGTAGVVPPIPPMPPGAYDRFGRGREPIWAFVLIGLGLIFLLQSMGVIGHAVRYTWPLLLIGFGVWLIIRRVGYKQGGSK